VAFRGSICENWQEAGLLGQTPLDCPLERRSELIARFDDLLRWADEGSAAALAKTRATLEILLWEIWEIRRHPSKNHSVLQAVAEFAAEHHFQVGAYSRLAKNLGLSMSSLRRHVLEASGLPLHGYTRSLRLREARRLLRQTNKSLADIAATLGFSDVYYFNREFSRMAGVPPAAYRKSEL
jgi:AraC family transcriptional regulator, arabinose operon regulatory protein